MANEDTLETMKQVVDGDTLKTEEYDKSIRVAGINTPESVHKDPSKNTPEGKVASEFATDVLPEKEEVKVHNYGADHFGRRVAGVKKVVNGVEIDYGLVALDQGMSTYYTEHGEHPDPQMHEQYKEFYSKHVPYQFGDKTDSLLTKEQFDDMTVKHKTFTETYNKFKNGKVTQEEFDNVTADLYKDPKLVAGYRQTLANWNRPIEEEDKGTIRGAMRLAMEADPALAKRYNRAVLNGHLKDTNVPEEHVGFWRGVGQDVSTAFSTFNSIAQGMDFQDLRYAQQHKSETEVPEEMLLDGVPEEWRTAILEENAEHGGAAALERKRQIIEDVTLKKQFDDMPLYAQFGYGALSFAADPLTYVGAGAAAPVGRGIVSTNKAWQMSRVIGGKGVVPASNKVANLTAWTAMGGVEGTIVNSPRLAADNTYNARDYMLDVMMDAGFGAGIGAGINYVLKPAWQYKTDVQASRRLEQDQILLQSEIEKQTKEAKSQGKPEAELESVEASTPELQEVKEQADAIQAEPKAKRRVAELTKTKFTPWAAISKVTNDGFKLASNTLQGVFKKQTPMRYLLNSQIGLNSKDLPPEVRDLADRLNADILHIASAFPDGKVPKAINEAINKATFKQKTTTRNNALETLVKGGTANPEVLLEQYVESLKRHTEIWEGYDPQPMDSATFFQHHGEILSVERSSGAEEMFTLTQQLPKEVSYIKDVVELNKQAAKSGDPRFIAAVEELNGLVSTRLEQVELGLVPRWKDPDQAWGKTVEMSPREIAARLKAEGLKPRTSEYSKRLKELRKTGRVAVPEEVRTIGKHKDFEVGRQSNARAVEVDSVESANIDFGEEKTISLKGDSLDQPLLPRAFNEVETIEAYKNPTKESLTTLREQLGSIAKKLGVKDLRGKKELKSQQKRLEVIKKAMIKDKEAVTKRMVKAGEWQNIEDVIRVAHTIVEEQKRLKNAVKSEPKKPVDKPTDKPTGKPEDKPEANPLEKPLTEEELVTYEDGNSGKSAPKVTDEEFEGIKARAEAAYEKLVEESNQKVANNLVNFVHTGEKKAFELARKPRGILDYAGRFAAKLTEDLGTKFQNGKLTSLEYIGTRLTEIGKGYGGAIRRKATAGLIRHAKLQESMIQIAPQYFRTMDDYAASKGATAWGKMSAQQKAGSQSKVVDQFNRDFFTVQELRRQGKSVDHIHKSVRDFADQWDKYMDYNHNQLVEANIGGFTKARKIKHYVPHVWKPGSLKAAIEKHGEDKIEQLFTKAYMSSINNGVNPSSKSEARELAKRQVQWIKEQGEAKVPSDQFIPVADSRAKARLDLDTTTEIDGVSIMDLLDIEVAGVATKYSNRMAGWVGLSEATDGMLTSQLDIDTLRKSMIQEGKEQGIDTTKYEQYYEDLMDSMFGRPTQGGLATELREVKDLTALAKMGGLGTAQSIETGQVITRSMMNLFSDPKVVSKVFKMAGESEKDLPLLREIQSISSITDDIEHLQRQSVHLDQAELDDISKVRELSLWIADKGTFGSLKAPASRLLGKTTGYNAVRRMQSRIIQSSFTVDVAKHFKSGKGKMSNARMADVGLTDSLGKDAELSDVFNKLVEYDKDGLPTKLNVDKWPESARKKFQYAMLRDEAQQIQQTIVGELPPWMNKPLMALLFQFRQMPIVAQQKQLSRSMAFADKEAVMNVSLNTAVAGLVRYSKFATLGLAYTAMTGEKWEEPNERQMQVSKYIAQLGLIPDAYDFTMTSFNALQDASEGKDGALTKMAGQVPVMGLANDYMGVVSPDSTREFIDSSFGIMMLGNHALADQVKTGMHEVFDD